MADFNSTYSVYYDVRRAEAYNSQNIPEDTIFRVRPALLELYCAICDPALDTYYTVTLSGLEDEWEQWNGVHRVEWSHECIWEFHLSIYARLSLSWSGINWVVQLLPTIFGAGVLVSWTNPTGDVCTPILDYGSHTLCVVGEVIGHLYECPPSSGDTSCVVSSNAYSEGWTAKGFRHSETSARIDTWPSLRQAVTDLADGDQEFTLSWSIMNSATDVELPSPTGLVATNVVALDSPNPEMIWTTQEIRSEIQDAFTEWKELFESVFSPPEYGGQLTVTFDNNLPGQTQGVEGSGGVSKKSSPNVTYPLPDPAGIGDIRIGVVDFGEIRNVAMTVSPGNSNLGQAGQLGSGAADIYFKSTYPFRLEGFSAAARIPPLAPLYNYSIKLIAAHEIGHSLGIDGSPHDTGRSDPDNFPDPPFPLMLNPGGLGPRYYKDFDDFFPYGLKASQWERRSLQEIYGYPPEE